MALTIITAPSVAQIMFKQLINNASVQTVGLSTKFHYLVLNARPLVLFALVL
jgi:uncharacterized pyridoxamine 5'-phosphate oxidase family protein